MGERKLLYHGATTVTWTVAFDLILQKNSHPLIRALLVSINQHYIKTISSLEKSHCHQHFSFCNALQECHFTGFWVLHLGAAAALIHLITSALRRDEGEIFVSQVLNLNVEGFISYGFSSDSLCESKIEHLRFKAFLKTQYYNVSGFKFWQSIHFCHLVY